LSSIKVTGFTRFVPEELGTCGQPGMLPKKGLSQQVTFNKAAWHCLAKLISDGFREMA
jgi:hypothetical protein